MIFGAHLFSGWCGAAAHAARAICRCFGVGAVLQPRWRFRHIAHAEQLVRHCGSLEKAERPAASAISLQLQRLTFCKALRHTK